MPRAGERALGAVASGVAGGVGLDRPFDLEAVRGALLDERLIDPRKYLGPGREVVAAEVGRLLTLLATSPY